MKTQKVKQILLGLIVPVLILAAWICATHFGNIPTSILPKISIVWQAFLEMLQSGQLWNDLSVTLSRVLKGYLLSAVLGTVLGSLMGMSKTVLHLLQPTVTVIRQIPIIAWIPLIILWCGIGELSKVVVIVMAAFFPIMIAVYKRQVVRCGNENGFAQQTANGSRFFLAICQCICGVPLQSAAIQLPLLGTVTGVCGQPDGVISLIIGQCRTGGNAGDLVVQICLLYTSRCV